MTVTFRYPRVAWQVAAGLVPARATAGSAERLMAGHARTFDFAARFLPPERRGPVVALYAFCRTLDDLVDEPMDGRDQQQVLAELEAWRAWFHVGAGRPAPREPLGRHLTAVRQRYAIPVDYFLDLVDGLASDLHPREMTGFVELRRYCYQVAATVGLAMAHVLGATTPLALAAAEDLGIAMQLTNILRDVGDDLRGDRLYLPGDDLARFGSSRAHLAGLLRDGRGPDETFRALMRFQIARARAYYHRGLVGVWLLPPDCRLPILVAGRLYRQILTVIERNGYDTLRRRAVTTRREKVREAVIALALVSRPGRRVRLDPRPLADGTANDTVGRR